jgi:hypothetical protein
MTRCLIITLLIVLIGCNDKEIKNDIPKETVDIIEKIDTSDYLILGYYFGMTKNQFKNHSQDLLNVNKIKKSTVDTNFYTYSIYSGGKVVEMTICPNFTYSSVLKTEQLEGIGLQVKSSIEKTQMMSGEIDSEILKFYTDKYGKPIVLDLGDEHNNVIKNDYSSIERDLSIKPLFETFWIIKDPDTFDVIKESSRKENVSVYKIKDEKYWRWKNKDKTINLRYTYSFLGSYSVFNKLDDKKKGKKILTDAEAKAELNNKQPNELMIKVYYSNTKDLNSRAAKQKTKDSLNILKAREKVVRAKNNKSDL